MILIDSSFLTSIGISAGNTMSTNQYEFHNGLTVNGVTVYNRTDFFRNATVNGVKYNNQYEWYKAIAEFYGEPIYDEYTFMINSTFDGINPIPDQYEYYKFVGSLINGGTPSAPVASFTSSTQSTAVGVTISFTDTSTNVPTSWDWNFGDGNTSTSQNPTHSYSSGGDYIVSMTASNAGGSDNATASISVASGFTPYDVDDLQLYLNVNDLSTINNGSPISPGDQVNKWLDTGTSGYPFTQGVSTQQPLYQTSYIEFDGTDDVLTYVTPDAFYSDTVGIIFFNVNVVNDTNQEFWLNSADSADNSFFFRIGCRDKAVSGQGKVYIQTNNGGGGQFSSARTVNTFSGNIYGFIKSNGDGNGWEISVNSLSGATQSLEVVPGSTFNSGAWFADIDRRDNFSVGALVRSTPAYRPGEYNKFAYYNRALTTQETEDLLEYFSDINN